MRALMAACGRCADDQHTLSCSYSLYSDVCVCVCVFRPATLHRLVLSQGGAGNAGRPGFVPKFNDAGRTTRGFFPGSNLEENAGDYITRDDGDGPVDRSRIIGDGKPGGRPNRDDKPPGVA